ncbi:MAG: hypothetical protein WC438_03485 [Candidatus Pacearchaeota archaeon]
MGFGDIFSKSWGEYKNKFWVFTQIFLLFGFLPSIILFLANKSYLENFNNLIVSAIQNNSGVFNSIISYIFVDNLSYTLFLAFLGILVFALGILMGASFIVNAFSGKKLGFKESLKGGKKYFWKYFWFSVVYSIFIILLFLLLVVPGIIFMIYWIFGAYILINENKGILASLKESRKLIKGKWWKTFGYFILFSLIIIVISWIASLIGFGLEKTFLWILGKPLCFEGFTNSIFVQLASVVIAPLSVLFFKNFYLSMKKR